MNWYLLTNYSVSSWCLNPLKYSSLLKGVKPEKQKGVSLTEIKQSLAPVY